MTHSEKDRKASQISRQFVDNMQQMYNKIKEKLFAHKHIGTVSMKKA